MDKYEARRQRLRQLIDERCAGVSASFAKQIGRDASYVTRMLYPEGKAGRKRIADDMMEVIETAFGLPRGWLDGIERQAAYIPTNALRVAEPESTAQLIAEHAAALRRAYHAAEVQLGGTHSGPRPHVRRAHWHSFWTGKVGSEERRLKPRWLPPIPVNLDDPDSIPAVIRPVKP